MQANTHFEACLQNLQDLHTSASNSTYADFCATRHSPSASLLPRSQERGVPAGPRGMVLPHPGLRGDPGAWPGLAAQLRQGNRQTLQGSFSDVSKPIFAIKYSLNFEVFSFKRFLAPQRFFKKQKRMYGCSCAFSAVHLIRRLLSDGADGLRRCPLC